MWIAYQSDWLVVKREKKRGGGMQEGCKGCQAEIKAEEVLWKTFKRIQKVLTLLSSWTHTLTVIQSLPSTEFLN